MPTRSDADAWNKLVGLNIWRGQHHFGNGHLAGYDCMLQLLPRCILQSRVSDTLNWVEEWEGAGSRGWQTENDLNDTGDGFPVIICLFSLTTFVLTTTGCRTAVRCKVWQGERAAGCCRTAASPPNQSPISEPSRSPTLPPSRLCSISDALLSLDRVSARLGTE